MDKEKAPSHDGFAIAFYQECWDTSKEEMLKVFSGFYDSSVINKSTNATFIVLVPKRNQISIVVDFRHINLTTNLYKAIAKI